MAAAKIGSSRGELEPVAVVNGPAPAPAGLTSASLVASKGPAPPPAAPAPTVAPAVQQQPQKLTGAVSRGIVKQVVSGDLISIRGQPMGGPPPEKTVGISNIVAPKLARRPQVDKEGNLQEGTGSKDEPFAWDAREYLRQKLIGKEVYFIREYEAVTTKREFGMLYLGKDANGENIAEGLVSEGFVEVKQPLRADNQSEYQSRLNELQTAAKSQGKGRWGAELTFRDHVRGITWQVEQPRIFADSLHQKPQKAVIEHVRDGSTVRAFLLPNFEYVTVMLSGVKCPNIILGPGGITESQEEYAQEAKYFTESRLLQREVEIILEGASNNNFVGSVVHPNGDIAEFLLKEGLAKCVDWSILLVSGGPEKLRAAERSAKDKRLRIWKDYTPAAGSETKSSFQGKVLEVVNGDSLMIKKDNGDMAKVFLSSIRAPRPVDDSTGSGARNRPPKPLYDYPFMFEAREFLRRRLIGKKVQVDVDYVQPAQDNFPEKICCTVMSGQINLAEALVGKGFATVLRYRQGDENRSAYYDTLLAAEAKAEKSKKGLHSLPKKGDMPPGYKLPILRVQDLQGEVAKSKQFLPYLQRAGRSDALVEFVSSGSRLRLYVPKETCLLTFLLSGINCPRGPRPLPGGATTEGEPFWEEAFNFTKERCLQREVEIEVETNDKVGNFVGYLFVDGKNLAESLVDQGLATVHFTAERSKHYSALRAAEERAKSQKLKLWEAVAEEMKAEQEERAALEATERSVKYRPAIITEVFQNLRFACQFVEDGPQLEEMMIELRSTLAADPPIPGAFVARRGEICAAKFSLDNQWYRARIDQVRSNNQADVTFIDFGNKETIPLSKLAVLPPAFHGYAPGAHEYALALVQLPPDPEFVPSAVNFLKQQMSIEPEALQVNPEYKMGGVEHATLIRKTKSAPTPTPEPAAGSSSSAPETAATEGAQATSAEAPPAPAIPESVVVDLGRFLIENGLAMVEERRERRLQTLLKDYTAAQEQAKRAHLNIWEYGDFTGVDF